MLAAFDISSTCIGYSVFNDKGSLIEMNYVKFNTKKSYLERKEFFREKIKHLMKIDIKQVAIEEPLEKFEGKFSSSHTIAVLNRFNGIISCLLHDMFKIEPIYYNVKHARKRVLPNFKVKKDGTGEKHQVWENVMKMEPQINWKYGIKSMKLLPENYDMADSYIIGKCHIYTIQEQLKNIN